MSKVKNGHPRQKTKISSRTKKYQIEDFFITNEKKGKKIRPRMGWFRSSGKVEILNVCWPLITLRSKYGKSDRWTKLHKLNAFKDKDNKQVICWYYKGEESLLLILNTLMPTIYYHIHLFRISSINQTWFRTCQEKWR